MVQMLGIGMESVCNFDKKNVFFSPKCKKTLSLKGGKNIPASKSCFIATMYYSHVGSVRRRVYIPPFYSTFHPSIICMGMDTAKRRSTVK